MHDASISHVIAHLLISPRTRLSLYDLGDSTVHLRELRWKGRYWRRRIQQGVALWFAAGEDVLVLEMMACAEAIAYSRGIACSERIAGSEGTAYLERIACSNRGLRILCEAFDHLPRGQTELRY